MSACFSVSGPARTCALHVDRAKDMLAGSRTGRERVVCCVSSMRGWVMGIVQRVQVRRELSDLHR